VLYLIEVEEQETRGSEIIPLQAIRIDSGNSAKIGKNTEGASYWPIRCKNLKLFSQIAALSEENTLQKLVEDLIF
jgi:hypothetical protein